MTAVGSLPLQSQIESVARQLPHGAQEDWRQIAQTIVQNLLAVAPGGQLLTAGGATSGSSATPKGVSLSVSGANGGYAIKLTNPASAAGRTVWHRVSYSTVRGFGSDVTVLPVTSATSIGVPLPGQTLFFQVESSFDQSSWSAPVPASSAAIASGLVSSAAISDATALNQTNYGVVTSAAVGSTAEVSISGAAAPLTSVPTMKGPTERILPGATVLGVTPGSSQFTAWDGGGYVLRPTLAGVLRDDSLVPIGAVSVVETGVPELPTVVPIITGGAVVGYDVTDQGNGVTGPLDLVVSDAGGGTGATTGTQTIVAGKLISVAPGNAGSGYSGATVVTASGGINPGTPGGGTAVGGNGGRLTAV